MRGKRTLREISFQTCSEHPRACGENYNPDSLLNQMGGTSPRMRGKRFSSLTGTRKQGNIPAHAGKTRLFSDAERSDAEHPRACGENWVFIFSTGHFSGTSPRMRGKPNSSRQANSDIRNIPAHAGKTLGSPAGVWSRWEHPRACGENDTEGGAWFTVLGTSPRMRGKLTSPTSVAK